ncbi:hypothetical protein [Anabaena sp. PCC 7108]|uniref:hypothetical protein n=1 Tax=Anabaena sp. PCC 7108 TaxID=163908 RepID=UPI000345689B|nr:hypothetical protein [Anabaena sp. PCC 7108]
MNSQSALTNAGGLIPLPLQTEIFDASAKSPLQNLITLAVACRRHYYELRWRSLP